MVKTHTLTGAAQLVLLVKVIIIIHYGTIQTKGVLVKLGWGDQQVLFYHNLFRWKFDIFYQILRPFQFSRAKPSQAYWWYHTKSALNSTHASPLSLHLAHYISNCNGKQRHSRTHIKVFSSSSAVFPNGSSFRYCFQASYIRAI